MHHIRISPPSGPINVSYSIATPTSHNAKSIVSGIPTIIFLHPVWIPQQIFEAQFSDPELRQFNLVAYDHRSYGETEGLIGNAETWTPEDDLLHFMDALCISSCHIFGLSMGSCVALDFATAHADRVLSLTLCSPLSPTEYLQLDKIEPGLREVHEYWCRASLFPDKSIPKQLIHLDEVFGVIDGELIREAILGIKQLAFNNDLTPLTASIIDSAMAKAISRWAGTPEGTREGFHATVKWTVERKSPSVQEISRLKCPVNVIYCTEDCAFTLDDSEALVLRLKKGGVNASLHQTTGSHYGCVEGAKLINDVTRKLVLSVSDPTSSLLTTLPVDTTTPFHELLERYGYSPRENEADSQVIDVGAKLAKELGPNAEMFIKGLSVSL